MKQIIVSAGVIIKDGLFMLAQRRPGDSEGLKWEFPGGKVEAGEEPAACLKRELNEELQIGIEVERVLDVISVVKNTLQIILIYYNGNILHGEPRAIECHQVRWFKPEEVDNLEKPQADALFWEKHKENLKTSSIF